MLKRLPGPGVQAVRLDTSMSQRLAGSCALPGSRQLMPMIAMGSRGPLGGLSPPALSLRTDHGVEAELSLSGVTLPVLAPLGLSESLIMVTKKDCTAETPIVGSFRHKSPSVNY